MYSVHSEKAEVAFNVVSLLILAALQYTVKNLEFALTVEPKNYHTDEKLAWAKLRRAKGLPTVPSTSPGGAQLQPLHALRDAQRTGGARESQALYCLHTRTHY